MEDGIEPSATELNLADRHFWGAVTNRSLREHLTPQIVALDLSTNHLTPESVALLADALAQPDHSVRYLSVVQTRMISRASVALFRAVAASRLLELFADDNIFNEDACRALADSLAADPPLELLSLCGCDIPSEGGAALAGALPRNRHLRHLRLESNSLYDPGAQAFGDALADSALASLSLADNEIWTDGMRALLAGCRDAPDLVSLDIAYNIVDVAALAPYLRRGTLQALAVSGAKVPEADVRPLLDAVAASRLQTLIVDGLNFAVLPISWPRVDDRLWQSPANCELLAQSIRSCATLADVRIGYLELGGLANFAAWFRDRELKLSIHDFGRTNNCWVVTFPRFEIESPTRTFEWRRTLPKDKEFELERITVSSAAFVGEIIRHTQFQNGPITEMKLNQIELKDEVLTGVLESIAGLRFDLFDFSDNPLTDLTLEHIAHFLSDPHAEIRDLNLSKIHTTDQGIARFFTNLQPVGQRGPCHLWLSFDSPASQDEVAAHECFGTLGELIINGYRMEELHISGPITATDAITVVKALPGNPAVRILDFESSHTLKYTSPDPVIPPEVQKRFDTLASELHHALRDKRTQSKLHTFRFPLFTEVFVYSDPVLEKWPECEERLETNKKVKGSARPRK
jgi:Ran GTPase-activating protein (RanGAP) involved in mRNA processing and transport